MLKKSSVFIVIILSLSLVLSLSIPTAAQDNNSPLIFPLGGMPGPDNWLIGQFYGNTRPAYNYRRDWYVMGQGLHFGIDIYAACGTPVLAAADGIVHASDAPSFGSDPHNLIIKHPALNRVTLYGHLLERPIVFPDQEVKQGEIVAYVGDSKGECTSRPHLHFELRSMDFGTTYNPINVVDIPWHTLALIGPLVRPQFQQDLYHPQRWLNIDDQPEVVFGGNFLNGYNRSWPYTTDVQPPVNPLLFHEIPESEPPATNWQIRQIGFSGCCAYPWWAAESPHFYMVNGVDDERANVFKWSIEENASPEIVYEAPPHLLSPDGTHRVTVSGDIATIENLLTGEKTSVDTGGNIPAISTDNSRLLWQDFEFLLLPNHDFPNVQTFVSDIDGKNTRMIWEQPGGESRWLDDSRVLILTNPLQHSETTFTIYETENNTSFTLGAWHWVREITVAPGGGRLMFYVMWQEGAGTVTIKTEYGATAKSVPWFGSWRWRDANSVYFIPFTTAWFSGGRHLLAYYNLESGELRYLTDINTLPFTIANGDWTVSPDGQRILFRNADDLATWLLEPIENR